MRLTSCRLVDVDRGRDTVYAYHGAQPLAIYKNEANDGFLSVGAPFYCGGFDAGYVLVPNDPHVLVTTSYAGNEHNVLLVEGPNHVQVRRTGNLGEVAAAAGSTLRNAQSVQLDIK